MYFSQNQTGSEFGINDDQLKQTRKQTRKTVSESDAPEIEVPPKRSTRRGGKVKTATNETNPVMVEQEAEVVPKRSSRRRGGKRPIITNSDSFDLSLLSVASPPSTRPRNTRGGKKAATEEQKETTTKIEDDVIPPKKRNTRQRKGSENIVLEVATEEENQTTVDIIPNTRSTRSVRSREKPSYAPGDVQPPPKKRSRRGTKSKDVNTNLNEVFYSRIRP